MVLTDTMHVIQGRASPRLYILSMNGNARLEGELRHALATLNACA